MTSAERGPKVGVGEIGFQELEPGLRPQRLEIRLFSPAAVEVGEAVEANHLGAPGQQPRGEVRTDESGGAGYQGPQVSTLANPLGQAARAAAGVDGRVHGASRRRSACRRHA